MGDGLVAAVVIIDETNGYVDIDGVKSLNDGLFEVSDYLIKRWKEMKEGKLSSDGKPNGATRWLSPNDTKYWLINHMNIDFIE